MTDTNGQPVTQVAPLRAREWKPRFLEALRENPAVNPACRYAGISRTHAYRERQKSPAFAEAWDEAQQAALDELEHDVFKRAKVDSDVLAVFLLKAHRGNVYREITRTEVTGADGGAVLLAAVVNERDRLADLITEETPAIEAPGADSGDAAAGGRSDQPPQGEG
jgi:hypothetical protein